MRLPEICIKHPVFATALNLLLITLGFFSYKHLETRFFPNLNAPIANITTSLPGANQQTMERSVTALIENGIANVDGIDFMRSTTSTGSSRVTVYFKDSRHLNDEIADLRDAVNAVRSTLPSNATPPIVTSSNIGNAIMSLSVLDSDPTVSPFTIRNYIEEKIEPLLQSLPGVGNISIYGASDYALRLWLNPTKMAALGITTSDVINTLNSNNIDIAAGSVLNTNRSFSVLSKTRLSTPEEFKNLIVKSNQTENVRLGDIARVEMGSSSVQNPILRINGKNGINIDIRTFASANGIEVAKAIKKILPNIQKNLPSGLSIAIANDNSLYLQEAVKKTFEAIIESIIMVTLIIYLFLGSFRASLIPITTIPVCFIAGFFLIATLGYSINTITLLAIVIAIGLVVDDAIVMLENIHRHIEGGAAPLQAAFKGSHEMILPIIAMTLTLAAVYAPIGFSTGPTAIIFKEFAFTLAGIVIISGFVALTLSPMLSSKLLQPKNKSEALAQKIESLFQQGTTYYTKILKRCLLNRPKIILLALLLAVFGSLLFSSLKSEFIPSNDTGQIMTELVFPPGATLQYMDRQMKKIEDVYSKIPEKQSYYVLANPNSGSVTQLTLKPWMQRDRSTQEVIQALVPVLGKIPGVTVFPYSPEIIDYGASTDEEVSIEIMTTGKRSDLDKTNQVLMDAFKKYPGFTDLNTTLTYNTLQYDLHINRDLAADLGASMSDISNTISVMLNGSHVTDFFKNNQTYPVMLQIEPDYLQDFNGIDALYVKSNLPTEPNAPTGNMAPLSQFVSFTPEITPPTLENFNRLPAFSITARLAPGYTASDAIHYINQEMPKALPPESYWTFDGALREMIHSNQNIVQIFLLAFLFIYLILSAQFGSFIDPFIILLSTPLSIVGGLLMLKLSGGTLNLYSEIGLVTLVGMISKHGILITQFTNVLREEGLSMTEALIRACSIRLRPILMTTAAMVFGTLPLILESGPGSTGRHEIGWVIIGGLLFGTLFSLIVVPVAYSYLGQLKKLPQKS